MNGVQTCDLPIFGNHRLAVLELDGDVPQEFLHRGQRRHVQVVEEAPLGNAEGQVHHRVAVEVEGSIGDVAKGSGQIILK